MNVNGNSGQIRLHQLIIGLCGLLPLLLIIAGCSTSGGGITIFPNDHKLLDSAQSVAMSMNRHAPTPRELQKIPLEAYYVQPGDVLLLEITDLDTDIRLPVDQIVMPDGTIDLADYGRPVVAGMTVEQIETLVHSVVEMAEPDVEIPSINVRLTVAESAMFYVLGEVNSPGAYPLIGRETVLDALMTAGGLSDRASDCEIILARPTPPGSCRVVLPICYSHIVQLGDTTTNYQIQPGDRIFVTTRSLCEQLMFWHRDCELCPDGCACSCGSPFAASGPPFVVHQPLTEPLPENAVPQFPNEDSVGRSVITTPAAPSRLPSAPPLAPPAVENVSVPRF